MTGGVGHRFRALLLAPASLLLAAATPVCAQTPKAGAAGVAWSTSIAKDTARDRTPARDREPPADRAGRTSSPPIASAGRIASSVTVTGDGDRTRLVLDLTAPAAFTIFRLTNPYRVVIDLDDVGFRLPPGSGQSGRGLVKAFRYGLFAPGKARIVIDTEGPARIEAASLTPGTGPVQLELSLAPTTSTELAAAEIAAAAHAIDERQPETAQPPPPAAPAARARPVIIVDPGHGGIDPGAQGARAFEKDVVLAVALEIQRALLASRRFEVVMTRSTDVFMSLDQRVKLSRKHQADLFVSVHADSLAQRELAQNIRGATVYTLADKATDDRAHALAEKENASDLLAGIEAGNSVADDQVRNILYDLLRRETANLATDFRGVLIGQLRPRLALAKDPMRSAPFKVLRQPGSPAVLIELGYMSNAEDEQQMSLPAWQRSVGEAVAKSVETYFRRKARAGQAR